MAAGKKDFVIEQGSDWIWSLTFENWAEDLSTYSARMYAKESVTDVSPVLVLTNSNTAFTLTSSVLSARVTAATTSAITSDSLVYDLELIGPTGIVTRLLEGQIDVSKEVTK